MSGRVICGAKSAGLPVPTPLLFLIALIAFGISTIAGGGAGLALIPVLGFVLPAAQVPAALSIGTSASSMARVAAFRSAIRWRVVARFVPASLPFAALGAWLLTRVPTVYLELALGAFLASNVILLVHKPKTTGATEATAWSWRAVGAAAGFLSGFVGAVGLVFNGFYLRSGLSKEQVVATRAANELLLHLIKLALYAALGLLTRDALLIGGVIAVAAMSAPFLARSILAKIDEHVFRRVGYAGTCVAGLVMLVSAGTSLAALHEIKFEGHLRLSSAKAAVDWSDGTVSVHWTRGRPPEFERTVEIATLPTHVRTFVEHVGRDAERIVCEQVLQFGHSSYEIVVVKAGERLKFKV